jgi:hypothetical protein
MERRRNNRNRNGKGRGGAPGQVKKVAQEPTVSYPTPIFSLRSLCILHLSEEDGKILSEYSTEFKNDLQNLFWQEVASHPSPLPHNISTTWFQ